MRKYQIPKIRRKDYNAMVRYLKTLPEFKRNIAEKKLYLIKSYEAVARKEIRRMGKKFKKGESVTNFCDKNGINIRTFYGYIKQYETYGMGGLIPHGWGNNKGKSDYNHLIPLIKELYKHDQVQMVEVFRKLRDHCIEHNQNYPSYDTVRRIILKNNLHSRKKKAPSPKKPTINQLTPDYIKIVDKKAFNIAMYKYSLLLPLLNPTLSKEESIKLKNEICNRAYSPFPGATIKIKPSTLNRYILLVKRLGVDGLIPKHCYRKTQKFKKEVSATITISMDKPWQSIKQLENLISTLPSSHEHEKTITLKLLKSITCFSHRYMFKPIYLKPQISLKEIEQIRALQTSSFDRVSIRAMAILMAINRHSLCEISLRTKRPVRTVEMWISKFKKEGIQYLNGKRDYSRQEKERRDRRNRIINILHHSPKDFGINRTAWILSAIADVYHEKYGVRLSSNTISRDIKKTDYTWKRAKTVLTSPDPKYKEKTQRVLDTLRNLGPEDAFFFIDEAGPWQVKKYGGKSLTLKGTVKIVPQFQSPKGRVSLIAALDALQNQVFHIPIKSKNTNSVIALIKILYYKYYHFSKLNITWDCASWHRSKQLKKFLIELKSKKTGPTINIVPLPKRSQFLNVIESVFGGLKKAVILNSNYESELEMHSAISTHFRDRNKYYKNNPKRAGNKIWDKEAFEFGDFKGGVYKKQM